MADTAAAASDAPVSDAPKKETSYTYWVRKKTGDAAPDPVPRKLSSNDLVTPAHSASLGSAWNQAGTWEEKCITNWATERLKELLLTLEPLEFNEGHTRITEISRCAGEASLVTVRNKKRYGYSYEIDLSFKGDWLEAKDLEGTLKIPEASYNDLDDLQLEVNLKNSGNISSSEKDGYVEALQLFLPAIREKLQKFEDELKSR